MQRITNHATTVVQARTRILLKHPFYGTLMLNAPLIGLKGHPQVPRAATDMVNIYYDVDYFKSISIEQIQFVLVHELEHIARCHGVRKRARNHEKWNAACDFAINWDLKVAGFRLVDDICIDQKYARLAAETIYAMLPDEPPPPSGGGSGAPGESGAGNAMPDVYAPGEVEGFPASGDMTPEAQEQAIKGMVAQAAMAARMAGNMPDHIQRLVDELLNPPTPWYDLLRDYMLRVTKNDESWSRRNRRFAGVYLPTRHSERMGEIALIGDTSGSITPPEMVRIASEARAIIEAVRPEVMRLVWADTRVANEQVLEDGDVFNPVPKGGGGTDMRVPLTHVEQFNPDVVVLVTDGHTPWPDHEPPYPLIVCCTTDAPVPIGQVVRL